MTENYSEEEKQSLLKLARDSIEAQLEGRQLPDTGAFPESLTKKRSSFVSLHTENGYLRGCIGNIHPMEPLCINVRNNAINASFRDPRFPPLSKGELDNIEIEISVLTEPEEISSWKDFIPGKHGIILRCGNRSAVFLPQVAPSQGWSREETLSHLSLKAGLPETAWEGDDCLFMVFRALVFSESDTQK